MIQDIFLEHEADSILSISSSTTLPGDKLVWTGVANGRFSVKSTYHLAQNRNTGGRGESSDLSSTKRFWQRLWRAKIPNKIKAFGWRACQNILPTKMNLCHRQAVEDPTCDECGLGPKTVLHVLCQRSKAKKVWNHCHFLNMIEGRGDFQDTLWQSGMT